MERKPDNSVVFNTSSFAQPLHAVRPCAARLTVAIGEKMCRRSGCVWSWFPGAEALLPGCGGPTLPKSDRGTIATDLGTPPASPTSSTNRAPPARPRPRRLKPPSGPLAKLESLDALLPGALSVGRLEPRRAGL